ncbi:DUF4748 domain-containing protein [Aquisediminimonas sediminicola]|nr:DUF4748 domain-containing protein [Aquisediminimonas sediminicola]
MRSSWVWLILLVAIVGGAFYFASINTEQPIQTINVPVNNAV